MAKARGMDVEVEDTDVKKGRDPDYVVLLRQQPVLGKDGRKYRSTNMSVVGAGWASEKMDEKTGQMIQYIGIKAHIKFEVNEEGVLLRTWQRDRD